MLAHVRFTVNKEWKVVINSNGIEIVLPCKNEAHARSIAYAIISEGN